MAQFTQHHFKVVAQVLSDFSAEYELINMFSDVFKTENPRFNPELFWKAAMKEAENPSPRQYTTNLSTKFLYNMKQNGWEF